MSTSSFALTHCRIHWRPGHAIRLHGWAVVSAVVYDGRNGIQTPVAAPPMKFKRKAHGDYDFTLAGDGLLIGAFESPPDDLGWLVTLTLTDTYGQAREVVDKTLEAAASLAAAIPGGAVASGALKAGQLLAEALSKITSARVIDSWIGSERDRDDLKRDWFLNFQGDKSQMRVSYDVED